MKKPPPLRSDTRYESKAIAFGFVLSIAASLLAYFLVGARDGTYLGAAMGWLANAIVQSVLVALTFVTKADQPVRTGLSLGIVLSLFAGGIMCGTMS